MTHFQKKISDEYPVLVVFLDLIMLGLFADFYEKYQIKEERERKEETERRNQEIAEKFFVQDGVATDTKTGLMWLRFSYGQRWENGNIIGDPEKINWHYAMKIPEEFNQKVGCGGFTDWRIPNIDELKTLIDKVKGEKGNYIDADIFPNTNIWFWSSSPDAGGSSSAWYVDFSNGFSSNNYKLNSGFVRLVRG